MSLVIIIICIFGLIGLVLFLPFKGAGKYEFQPPVERFHEADAVLSRRLLQPGTAIYNSYYDAHSGYKQRDDRSREEPGLLASGSLYYDPATFTAAKANFQITDHIGSLTHGTHEKERISVHPGNVSRFITRWLKQTGAHSIGYTVLHNYHLYSHKGRGSRTGEPLEMKHGSAIAITVEMDHRMMQSSPRGTAVMESSEQYLRSGVLALKLAAYIRNLGYDATAHIDGNYEVICPLVAVDAGLGIIGRMGLLMTPKLGPRIRISVVTTDMPVAYSNAKPDPTMIHFCTLCKKCADACPAGAIPSDPMGNLQGVRRWRINSEKCYHYWTVSGTDCGRCIMVCPYSHPDNLFHRLIRRSIKNNLFFRQLAVKLEDVFYGRIPGIRPLPDWADLLDEP